MNSLLRENIELRRELAQMRATARLNHQARARAIAREHALLGAETLQALMEELACRVGASFGVAATRVVIEDTDHEIRQLLTATCTSGTYEVPEGLTFCDWLEDVHPDLAGLERPWLGPYYARRHASLFAAGGRRLGSVALVPLRQRSHRPRGVICLADTDTERFEPELATDNLDNLGIVAAISLQSAMNNERLVVGAITDPLTRLHNRRYLDSRLAEELSRAHRDQSPLACLLMDLDYFKQVNDKFGHLAGDDVLREVARRVADTVRASDVCARFGGEELAVLLPRTRRADAVALAERLRVAISGAPILVGNGRALTVTASLGVATLAPGGEELPAVATAGGLSLLEAADRALYQAKSAGRDRVCNAA